MFFRQRQLPDYISQSLEILETHPQDWLTLYATAYQVLDYENPDAIVRLGNIAYQYLSTLTVPQIVKVGEQWRQYTSMLWSIDWQNIDIKSMSTYFDNRLGYESLLIMGSFHPSGYFRENCLKILSFYPNTLAFMMIRMNDWVQPVQTAAYTYTDYRISESSLEELLQAAFVFMKVKLSKRRYQVHFDEIEDHYLCRFKELIDTLNIQYLFNLDVLTRKAFYQITTEHSLLSLEIIEELLQKEKDGFCLLLLTSYFLRNEQLDVTKLQSYLHHHTFYVRKEAIIRYYELRQDIWEGIEEFLLDRSYAIRDYIRFLLRKHTSFDILNFYLQHLDDPMGILGVGECGNEKHISILLPYLENQDEKVVKVTIQALSHLMKEQGSKIYWQFLLDNRISLSKAAYQSIMKNKVHYGASSVYAYYQQVSYDYQKRYLLRILLEEDSWERLPYLLTLYSYADEKLCQHIQMKVKQRNPYQTVTRELKAEIIHCLNDQHYQIPEDVKKSILFDLKFVCKD